MGRNYNGGSRNDLCRFARPAMLSSPLGGALDACGQACGRYSAPSSAIYPANMNTGITIATVLVMILTASAAHGQEPSDSHVKQATFSRPASSDAAQQVSFARQSTRVGDEIEQNLGLDLRMTMTMRQASEMVGKSQTTVRTSQKRVLTTMEVDHGRIVALRLQYPIATKQESIIEGIETNEPKLSQQPVQGKTYICRRDGGENGELVVTDEAGNRPPTDEYEIVAQQMQMVGRTNPLAEFLDSRTIAVGEKIELPPAVASQVFNLGDKFGKVSRFTLMLKQVQTEGGVKCAVFQANVEAFANAATQMRLEVEGPLVVDVATCRAQKIGLVGPIGMSETRGSYSTAYQVIGTGKLQMNVASNYRDAKQ
jgi:hypothetical protein